MQQPIVLVVKFFYHDKQKLTEMNMNNVILLIYKL